MKKPVSKDDLRQNERHQETSWLSEDRYSKVFNNTEIALAVFEADGMISWVNDEFVHLTGYQKDELVGRMSLWDFMQPEETERIQAYHHARRLDSSNPPGNYVFHLVDKSGMHREIYAALALPPDSSSMIASWIDIDQQKGLEEFTKGTLDSLGQHIAILDSKGTILSVNRAWAKFAQENGGNLAETGPGVNYLEVCDRTTGQDQESAGQFAEGLRKVLSAEIDVFTLEYPCHSKHEQRWFLGRITRFKMGDSLRAVVSHENITHLKEVEISLRENEALYQTIVDNQSELVCRYLPDTTLTFANAAYCRYFGRDRAEMIGRRFLDFIPEEQHADVLEYIRTLIQTLTSITMEHQVLTPSGELRWQSWTDYPIFDLNGELKEFQAVGKDITEQKQAQEALANAHNQVTTLLEISGKLLSTLEFEPLLDLILDQLSKVLSYDGAVIMTLRHQNLDFQVYRGAEIFHNLHKLEVRSFQIPMFEPFINAKGSFYIDDIHEEQDLLSMLRRTPGIPLQEVMKRRSWLGLPLLIQDQIIGFLILAHAQPQFYSQKDRDLAQAFANQVALALRNAQLYRQAQQAAAMDERNRLARELHDSIAQMLYSMNLYSKASMLALSSGKNDVVEENLDKLAHLTRDAMSDMRQLIFELRPSIVEEDGLVSALDAALEAAASRYGIKTELQVEGEIQLDSTIETELYRIAQEALNNVNKHARATRVDIELKNEHGLYSLSIRDNGIGFDPVLASQGGGVGLRNIRDRARAIGGNFLLETSPEKGTVVKVQFHF
jgi:PAS domain S-box-containing protein